MKKAISILLCISMVISLAACGARTPAQSDSEGGFAPKLDANTDCSITVAGR